MLMIQTLEEILRRYRENGENIIFLLQETQEALGYIPREAIDFFSRNLSLAPSRFYGIATFYAQFRLTPAGRHKITACCGTACHVRGAERILNRVRQELRLSNGQETTTDGQVTLEQVSCVGACSIAPVFLVNRKVCGKSSAERIIREIRTLREVDNAEK